MLRKSAFAVVLFAVLLLMAAWWVSERVERVTLLDYDSGALEERVYIWQKIVWETHLDTAFSRQFVSGSKRSLRGVPDWQVAARYRGWFAERDITRRQAGAVQLQMSFLGQVFSDTSPQEAAIIKRKYLQLLRDGQIDGAWSYAMSVLARQYDPSTTNHILGSWGSTLHNSRNE